MKKLPTYEDDHEEEGVGVDHAGVLPPRAHAPEEGDNKYDHTCNKEKKKTINQPDIDTITYPGTDNVTLPGKYQCMADTETNA
jgi:hypothetical protein